jgi:hypothetical protein
MARWHALSESITPFLSINCGSDDGPDGVAAVLWPSQCITDGTTAKQAEIRKKEGKRMKIKTNVKSGSAVWGS